MCEVYYDRENKKILPNVITLSRLVILILGFILFTNGETLFSIILYIIGSISDALDGYLARRWNVYTKLGSYLDAICDKFYALSIIIISLMYGNDLMIIIILLELIISIINYLSVKKNGQIHTERVGKYKMTFEFILLIIALLLIKIKSLWYLFIVMLIVTVYFEIQSINAYINQKNNKKMKLFITEKDYLGKTAKEKMLLIFKEFKYYLLNPVKVIK